MAIDQEFPQHFFSRPLIHNHPFCFAQNDADTADPDSLCDEAGEKIGDLEQKLALANASNEMFEEEIRSLKSAIGLQSQDVDRLNNESKGGKDKKQDHYLEATISEHTQEEEQKLQPFDRQQIRLGSMLDRQEKMQSSNDMFEEEIQRLKSTIEGQTQYIDRLIEAKKKKNKEQAHLEAKITEYRKKYLTIFEEKSKFEEKLDRQKKELATLNKKVMSSTSSSKGGGNPHLMARIERQKRELARLNKQVEKKSSMADVWKQIQFIQKFDE